MYAIAKDAMHGRKFYVTRILRGGLSIDNQLSDPDARYDIGKALARKFKTLAAAEKALGAMRTVGGFDDYQILEIDQ